MKKIFFFLILVHFFGNLNGQLAVILCNTPGEDCFKPNPETFITYLADVNNNGVGSNVWAIDSSYWTATPLNQLVNPNSAESSYKNAGAAFFTTRWLNTNNAINATANQKRVTLKLKVSRTETINNVQTVVRKFIETFKIINVKYIGPIASATVQNGTPSTSSNGQSVSLPCGSQTFTISVPTPANGTGQTGDSAVPITYTWTLPNGWNGSSSTNSISIFSTVGEDGIISVSAKRSDGTYVQNFNINLTRPRVGIPLIVTVDGSPLSKSICSGQSKSFQGTSITNVTNRYWQTSGGIYINGPMSAPTVMIGGSSQGALTLTVDNACQSPQSRTVPIYAGPPTIQSATVNGYPQSVPNYIYNPALLNVWTDESGVTDSWAIINGTGSLYFNGQLSVSAYAYPFIRVQATITNQCGASASTIFYLHDISGGYYRMASPNPADNSVSAEVLVMDALKKVTLVSDSRSGIVRTFNPSNATNANTQRNNNTFSFDVAQLPRGKYYLNFTFEGNKTFSEQIVLR